MKDGVLMNDDKYVSKYQKALQKQLDQARFVGDIVTKLAEESARITKLIV